MEGKPGMETESCLASKLSNNYFKLALLSYISIFSLLSFFLLFLFFFFPFFFVFVFRTGEEHDFIATTFEKSR